VSQEIRLFSVPRELATSAKTVLGNLLADQPAVTRLLARPRKVLCDLTFVAQSHITTPEQATALRTVILERAATAGVLYISRRGRNEP